MRCATAIRLACGSLNAARGAWAALGFACGFQAAPTWEGFDWYDLRSLTLVPHQTNSGRHRQEASTLRYIYWAAVEAHSECASHLKLHYHKKWVGHSG